MIRTRTPAFRPSVEFLENRLTPAGTVNGTFANGVWTLTGDADANDITINSNGTPGSFTVISNAGTTVTGVTNRGGIKSIKINFLAGADVVTFNTNATPVKLAGSLVINGGEDDNDVFGTGLRVKKNVLITNGTNAAGVDSTEIENLNVGGNFTINNGDGDTNTYLYGSAAQFSRIGGNLKITNGTGYDSTALTDTNIGGNVICSNGASDGVNAGVVQIFNVFQTTKRAVIGGNVLATFLDGVINYNGIWDTVVKGNVTFNNGSGAAETRIDGYQVNKQVAILGNLTIRGTGVNEIYAGTSDLQSGLKVGKNLTIDLGAPAAPLEMFKVNVGGKTTII